MKIKVTTLKNVSKEITLFINDIDNGIVENNFEKTIELTNNCETSIYFKYGVRKSNILKLENKDYDLEI